MEINFVSNHQNYAWPDCNILATAVARWKWRGRARLRARRDARVKTCHRPVGRSDPDRRRQPWENVAGGRASVRAVVTRGNARDDSGGPSVCSANVPVGKELVGRPDPWPPSSPGEICAIGQ